MDVQGLVRYYGYCDPSQPYFDVPAADRGDDFAAVHQPPPAGWRRRLDGDWVNLAPDRSSNGAGPVELPDQGWKIHASATLDNAERVLDEVARYCTDRCLTYKFLRSPTVLFNRNSKYGDRSASGKFATIYPVEGEALARTLHELGDRLDGEAGPYILSDLRWRSGPLYVRYGAFRSRQVVTPTGEVVECITDPDGRLVPDHRGPGFRPPPWVPLPDCLQEAMAARRAGTLRGFPYEVERALHFSNGGGVYVGRATAEGDARVVLREARPGAGLDEEGRDAVARQERERWALERLRGLPSVPELVDHRRGHEHFFLVRRWAEGVPLAQAVLARNPLLTPGGSGHDREGYARWALGVLARIRSQLEAMHDRGVVFGDLHPGNLIVDGDRINFIDFEAAMAVDDWRGQSMAVPGFRAPPGVTGADIDRFALDRLHLTMFLPLENVLAWAPSKAPELAAFIAERFPVPVECLRSVVVDHAGGGADDGEAAARPWRWPTRGGADNGEAAVRRVTADLARGIVRSAQPDRPDRYFPGDAAQFLVPGGGYNLAYGAAGVVWALHVTGHPVPDDAVGAMCRLADAADGPPRVGLYDGLAGVAHVLAVLGRVDEARTWIDRPEGAALSELADTAALDDSLAAGVAGVALVHLDLARRTGDGRLWDAAVAAGEQLVAAGSARTEPGRPGLLHGASGPALLLVCLFEVTGESRFLEAATRLLVDDVGALTTAGRAGVPGSGEGGGRVDATLASGGGGTALAIDALLAHRDHERLRSFRRVVADGTDVVVARQAGLFHGAAGLLATRCGLSARPDPAGAVSPARGLADAFVREQIAGLGLHVVDHDGSPAVLGMEGLRISTDLATGGAGVLLALDAAVGGRGPRLPFLAPTAP